MLFKRMVKAVAMPMLMIMGVGSDTGWAGSFVPMIVSEATLIDLRNLAGPPPESASALVAVNFSI